MTIPPWSRWWAWPFDGTQGRLSSGQGYVGLPLRLRSGQALTVTFAERGFPVVGIDVDAIDVDGRKVDALNRGELYVQDIPAERLTPLSKTRDPDCDEEAGCPKSSAN